MIFFLLDYHSSRFCIAPWKVLEQYGIKGPRPVPIFGNYLQFRTVVSILVIVLKASLQLYLHVHRTMKQVKS